MEEDRYSESLEQAGRNLSRLTLDGKLPLPRFREQPIAAVMSALQRGRSVLLVGDVGVGKTSIVHGVAHELPRVARDLWELPTMAVLFFISIDDFLYSVSINERSSSGAWTPIIWPLRGVIPLTAFMLFLQGISEVMKSLWAWRTGEFLTQHEKIEV